MMRMRQLLKQSVLSVGVGLALMVLLVNFALPRRDSKWTNFEKIKPGMTDNEVKSIMGETELYFPSGVTGPFSHGWRVDATLFSDEYCLQANFDHNWTNFDHEWKVIETRSYPVEQSYFRRFVRSLGW